MRWRIYYADGSTFSDRDGTPFEAPPAGAIVVAVEAANAQGFTLDHGDANKGNFYWRPDVGWQCCDMAGLWDYLLLYRGPKAVLLGRSLRDSDFWAIIARAGKEGLG